MAGPIAGVGGASAAAVVLAATAWTSFLLARTVASGASASARWAATAILGYANLYGTFCLLLALHRFTLEAVLLTAVLPALAAHLALGGKDGVETLRDDLRSARGVGTDVARSPWGLAAGAVAALAAVRVLRGSVIPPMGWDALTYHLYKAGRWAQMGTHLVLPAPDSWGYYEHFPSAGDAFWAFAFLAAPDGAFLAVAGGLVWGTLLLGAYAAARRWGADRRPAVAAALAVSATPAVMAALTASYVDNTLAALFVLALPFLGVGARRTGVGGPGEGALAGIALSLGAAVKTSLLPVVAATLAIGAALAVGRRDRRGRAVWLAAFAVSSLAVLAVEYGPTWARTGSPTYPFPVRLAGLELAPGNPELDLLMTGKLPAIDAERLRSTSTLPWLFGVRSAHRSDSTGLGPGAVVLLGLGVAGVIRLARDNGRRASMALALCGALVLLATAYSPDAVALRGLWPETFARHVVPAYAVAVIAASVVPWRPVRLLWALALASSVALSVPRGWGAADARATAVAAAWLAGGLSLAAIAALVLRGRAVRARVRVGLGTFLALLPVAAVLPAIRGEHRYVVWASAAQRNGPYDLQGLSVRSASAWPIWERLDGKQPARIAVASGWNGLGQVWYLYPLLGSRLQNRVTYVPPTADGGVVDYREAEELARRANGTAWIRRLVDQRIDFVVTMTPSPPERILWIERLPGLFTLEWGDERSDCYLYRFDRDAARAYLGSR